MARYTDEGEALIAAASELRLQIARRIAEEAGHPPAGAPDRAQLEAADAAIAAWTNGGEEEQDPAAFRPIGPLQSLLGDYCGLIARIDDWRDRQLS